MKKPGFYTELSYILGILILAFGTALVTLADFGLSMVVAPAYLIHLKLSQYWSFITFGVAEYLFQALLLIILSIILKRFKISYLFSFVTAVLYGLALDGCIFLTRGIPAEAFWVRIVLFVVGTVLCTIGVSLFFHTYISPEAYEVFVKDFAQAKGLDIGKTKIAYDFSSCALSIIMSFCFFGLFKFEGINVGTIVMVCVNGALIGFFNKKLDKYFEFKDALPLRKYFER
ncbi:MAG: hypothetical protein IJZ57_03375 [Clostridia bacterium]|nr:hypothetical protein [Clostridia bacterium]